MVLYFCFNKFIFLFTLNKIKLKKYLIFLFYHYISIENNIKIYIIVKNIFFINNN